MAYPLDQRHWEIQLPPKRKAIQTNGSLVAVTRMLRTPYSLSQVMTKEICTRRSHALKKRFTISGIHMALQGQVASKSFSSNRAQLFPVLSPDTNILGSWMAYRSQELGE